MSWPGTTALTPERRSSAAPCVRNASCAATTWPSTPGATPTSTPACSRGGAAAAPGQALSVTTAARTPRAPRSAPPAPHRLPALDVSTLPLMPNVEFCLCCTHLKTLLLPLLQFPPCLFKKSVNSCLPLQFLVRFSLPNHTSGYSNLMDRQTYMLHLVTPAVSIVHIFCNHFWILFIILYKKMKKKV